MTFRDKSFLFQKYPSPSLLFRIWCYFEKAETLASILFPTLRKCRPHFCFKQLYFGKSLTLKFKKKFSHWFDYSFKDNSFLCFLGDVFIKISIFKNNVLAICVYTKMHLQIQIILEGKVVQYHNSQNMQKCIHCSVIKAISSTQCPYDISVILNWWWLQIFSSVYTN